MHILSFVLLSIARRADAKLAADLAAAAHEETLQHLRDKAAATVALKHKEFKTSLAHVADTHAARAVEIRTMFTEMATWYVCFSGLVTRLILLSCSFFCLFVCVCLQHSAHVSIRVIRYLGKIGNSVWILVVLVCAHSHRIWGRRGDSCQVWDNDHRHLYECRMHTVCSAGHAPSKTRTRKPSHYVNWCLLCHTAGFVMIARCQRRTMKQTTQPPTPRWWPWWLSRTRSL